MVLLTVSFLDGLTVQQNRNIDLKHPVRINDYPSDDLLCNISILDPNNNHLVDFQPMTNDYDEHNYTLTNTSVIGEYTYDITCTTGSVNKTESFNFYVTPTGSRIDTAESIIYIIFVGGLIFTFLLLLYGSIKIPYRHSRSDDGKIIDVNQVRYFKVVCIVFAYLILMAIFGILRQITANYLFLNQAHKTFQWLFWFMLSFTFPTIVVSLVFMLVLFIENKRVQKAIFRGVPVR